MAKGRCYIDIGRLDEAESVLSRSLQIHQDLDLKLKIVVNKIAMAKVHLGKEDTESARRYLAEARDIAAADDNRSDLAKISRLEAHLLLKEGQDPMPKFEETVAGLKALGKEQDVAQVLEEIKSLEAEVV